MLNSDNITPVAVLMMVPQFAVDRMRSFNEPTEALINPEKLVKYFSSMELLTISALMGQNNAPVAPGVTESYPVLRSLKELCNYYIGTTRTISDVTVQTLKSAAEKGSTSLQTYYPDWTISDTMRWFLGDANPMEMIPRISSTEAGIFIHTWEQKDEEQSVATAMYWFYRNTCSLMHKYYGLKSVAKSELFRHYLTASAQTMTPIEAL